MGQLEQVDLLGRLLHLQPLHRRLALAQALLLALLHQLPHRRVAVLVRQLALQAVLQQVLQAPARVLVLQAVLRLRWHNIWRFILLSFGM